MNEAKQVATSEWARHLPCDEIPSVILYLAARLVAEADSRNLHNPEQRNHPDKLLRASELAKSLNLPESWIRNEERMRRIPSIRAGKYVRFKQNEVEEALAKRAFNLSDLLRSYRHRVTPMPSGS